MIWSGSDEKYKAISRPWFRKTRKKKKKREDGRWKMEDGRRDPHPMHVATEKVFSRQPNKYIYIISHQRLIQK
jgi:hypothetical protein